MKCWTVNEDKERGIKIVEGDDGIPVFRVGTPEACTVIPVSKDIQQLFDDRKEAIWAIRAAAGLEIAEMGKRITRKIARAIFSELDEEQRTVLRKVIVQVSGQDVLGWEDLAIRWLMEDPSVMRLNSADLSTNEPFRLIKERNKRSDVALVHVETAATGQMWYEGNGVTEFRVDCRRPYVGKEQHGFPSPGVETLATGHGGNGEPQGLFLMIPRASFRINRDQHPEVLVVSWPGSSLKCFAPVKIRKKKDARAA